MQKTIIIITLLLLNAITAGYAQKKIQVSNPDQHSRTEIISIPYATFAKSFAITDEKFVVKESGSGDILYHQLETLGQSSPQNILIQVEVGGRSTKLLEVEKGTIPVFEPLTYARYVPERKDDFAWENDIVAFRAYGKALEGTSEDAQGFDFWAKRTSDLIINKWYKEDDYHRDHGEGLDYYSVGQTLGAGDIALYYNDEVHYTKHYRAYEILDNGPLRTTFRLTFHPEEINGNNISLSKTISLDAGSQFNKITIELDNQDTRTTPIAVGVVKRKEASPEFDLGNKNHTFAYWEPEIDNNGRTGIALILPKTKTRFLGDREEQFLLLTTAQNDKSYTYYNGATWDRAGKITTAQEWFDEVKRTASAIKKPLKVKLK